MILKKKKEKKEKKTGYPHAKIKLGSYLTPYIKIYPDGQKTYM